MDDFLGIAIVGVFASLIIEWINNISGANSTIAKAITVGVSVVLGAIYFFFGDTAVWQSILGVLATASTVYAFLLKK